MLVYLIVSSIILLASFLFAMLGLGGGMVYVPVLTWAGFPVKDVAIPLGLLLNGLNTLLALIPFARKGLVDWKGGLSMAAAAFFLAPVGAWAARFVPVHTLLILFAAVKTWSGYTGLGYLVLAHSAFCVPFAYLPIRARLEGMDLSLETAAADLYASRWRVFRRVTLPLMAPGIAAGAMLAFVISLDDVIITEFVKSAGQGTLPTYMLGQMRRAITPEVNAISTALLALTVLLLTAFFLLTRSRNRNGAAGA